MEADQVDIFALPVLRYFEQIDDAQESGLSRQCWSDLLKTDGFDRIHFDLTFFHLVAVAGFNVGALPYPDAACDLSSTNPVAEPLGEHHEESLRSSLLKFHGAIQGRGLTVSALSRNKAMDSVSARG